MKLRYSIVIAGLIAFLSAGCDTGGKSNATKENTNTTKEIAKSNWYEHTLEADKMRNTQKVCYICESPNVFTTNFDSKMPLKIYVCKENNQKL